MELLFSTDKGSKRVTHQKSSPIAQLFAMHNAATITVAGINGTVTYDRVVDEVDEQIPKEPILICKFSTNGADWVEFWRVKQSNWSDRQAHIATALADGCDVSLKGSNAHYRYRLES